MKRRYIILLIFAYWGLVAFPTSHPITTTGGYTGAPLDSFCTTCHQDQNQNLEGDAIIKGIPPYVFHNETYPITIEVTSRAGSVHQAGFQLLALEADLSNGGELINNSENSVRKVAGGKRYLGHNPAVRFENDTLVSWPQLWKIEDNDDGFLTLYLAAMLGSGNAGNRNDRAIFKSFTTEVRDSTEAIWAFSEIVSSEACADSTRATLKINDYGGISPISYQWNTEDSTAIIENIGPGTYHYTVTDIALNSFVDSVTVTPIPTSKIDSINIILQNDQLFTIEIIGSALSDDYYYYYKNIDLAVQDSSQNPIIENLPSGKFKIWAKSQPGCTTDSIEIVLDINTRIDDLPLNIFDFDIFPNPVSEVLYIKSSIKDADFYLSNIKGQSQQVNADSNNSINVDNLSSGIYILSLIKEKDKSSKIFIKI
jgi:hypothetical protein